MPTIFSLAHFLLQILYTVIFLVGTRKKTKPIRFANSYWKKEEFCIATMIVIKENAMKKDEEIDTEKNKTDHRQQCDLNFIFVCWSQS